ncbi:MAG: flagellar hook-associated protein FlgK [Clostridiales bacterium]|nr:flagellar hook-associated protein FlgK [Clostridiales bacterium]
MRSTFYGLEIARSGLFTSQQGLSLTGHNIDNSDTEGYTRQRIVTKSIEPPINTGLLRSPSKGQIGGGVDVVSIDQIRDSFLDMQYRRENTTKGEWQAKTSALQYIEDVFREPSKAGINQSIAELFDSMQELAKYPESKEIRSLVRQDAIKLTETLGHYDHQLKQLRKEQDTAINIAVMDINDIIVNIRDLNLQIFKFETGGDVANDLRDRRNLLMDQLSEIIDVDYYETRDGRFRVDVAGMPLVDHVHVNKLESVLVEDEIIGGQVYTVKWEGLDRELPITGGRLKGLIEMRDGRGPEHNEPMGIPYFVEQLDNLAKAFVQEFNAIHRRGYSLHEPGEDGISEQGYNFFAYDGANPKEDIDISKVTAANFSVATEIMEDIYNIAMAEDPTIDADGIPREGDNRIGLEIIGLRNKKDITVELIVDGESKNIAIGNLEDYTKGVIADLAVESSHSDKMSEGQVILTNSLQNKRLSVSGVSIDEEMTMMIQYLHSYNAAARMITAVDEQLDVLINRTGLVGR